MVEQCCYTVYGEAGLARRLGLRRSGGNGDERRGLTPRILRHCQR